MPRQTALHSRGEVVGRIANGEFGYNVGAFIAHPFVDADHGSDGTVEVQRSGIRHRARIIKGPLFDATSQRLKG